MIILVLSLFALLGASSAHNKVVDYIALTGLIFAELIFSIFFNTIFPAAPIISYWEPHKMIFWVFEQGPDLFATLIVWSPLVYFASKVCSEISRSMRKVTEQSTS